MVIRRYIRVSAWEYTTPADFVALADVLNYNTRLDRGVTARAAPKGCVS